MSQELQGVRPARWRLAPPPEVAAELARDRGLFLAIAAYAACAAVMALALGRPGDLVVFTYLPFWIFGAVVLALLAITVVELPRSIRAAPASPLSHLVGAVRARINPRLVAGVLLFAAMALFYGAFTSIKSMLPHLVPFSLDRWAADMDARLHGGVAPWALLQPLLGHHWVTRAIQHLYMPGWTFLLFGATAAMAMSRRLAPLRAQFFWTYLLLWPLLGNLLAGAVMTAGPIYYGLVTGDSARFGEILRYVRFSAGLLNSSYDLQGQLWGAYQSGKAGLGSGISAFPSMHVAMATLYVLAARRIDRRLAWAAAAFALAIFLGSIHLGWHYAVDGYASAALTVLVWLGVGFALRRGRRDTSGRDR
jgi:hypothetical protein